ncbi:hypothetical protein GH975_09645 [Litorivicinus lipolyticus]|uniref:DsrE/DsrF-like family protein n=1 Tax=Litorivicinus lipolyticus TaxID=418701 RepID=A0A5Q2QFP9_9GAMM|nr:DsrE family protein [Litorivicinus lipolyticus]QGG80817.1 hypothetical protein GH975_09645 [Litorivicinus lipolyticus]
MLRTLTLAAVLLAPLAMADTLKAVFQVNSNDPKTMNIALNNINNTYQYFQAQGQDIDIELVAYGPGLHMFRKDTSPVSGRLEAMAMEIEGIQFSACNNTMKGMTKKEGKAPELIDETTVVPSGVVRLIELQNQGYAYIKP